MMTGSNCHGCALPERKRNPGQQRRRGSVAGRMAIAGHAKRPSLQDTRCSGAALVKTEQGVHPMAKERAQLPIVSDETQTPELVHKATDARMGVPIISARGSWLTFAMIGSGRPSLPKFGQQKRGMGQAFLTGIEELVHKVFLDPNAARQQVRDK